MNCPETLVRKNSPTPSVDFGVQPVEIAFGLREQLVSHSKILLCSCIILGVSPAPQVPQSSATYLKIYNCETSERRAIESMIARLYPGVLLNERPPPRGVYVVATMEKHRQIAETTRMFNGNADDLKKLIDRLSRVPGQQPSSNKARIDNAIVKLTRPSLGNPWNPILPGSDQIVTGHVTLPPNHVDAMLQLRVRLIGTRGRRFVILQETEVVVEARGESTMFDFETTLQIPPAEEYNGAFVVRAECSVRESPKEVVGSRTLLWNLTEKHAK